MRNVISAALLLLATLASGCDSKSPEEKASTLGNQPFSVEEWASADQIGRGEMVASFLRVHPVTGKRKEYILKLLGNPTGYYDYDENLAYVVGPRDVKSDYAKGHLLVFETDKSTGAVARVMFVPDIET